MEKSSKTAPNSDFRYGIRILRESLSTTWDDVVSLKVVIAVLFITAWCAAIFYKYWEKGAPAAMELLRDAFPGALTTVAIYLIVLCYRIFWGTPKHLLTRSEHELHKLKQPKPEIRLAHPKVGMLEGALTLVATLHNVGTECASQIAIIIGIHSISGERTGGGESTAASDLEPSQKYELQVKLKADTVFPCFMSFILCPKSRSSGEMFQQVPKIYRCELNRDGVLLIVTAEEFSLVFKNIPHAALTSSP